MAGKPLRRSEACHAGLWRSWARANYGLWHKEIFADLAALLLGGPAAAWGMAIFLAHPPPRTMTFKAASAHPTGYVRILLLVEMLRRMGFSVDAARLERVWRRLYDVRSHHRMPHRLLATVPGTVPQLVDEIAFQTRRNLAQRALADVILFGAATKTPSRTPRDGSSAAIRHRWTCRRVTWSVHRVTPCLLAEKRSVVVRTHCDPLGRTPSARPASLGEAQLTLAA